MGCCELKSTNIGIDRVSEELKSSIATKQETMYELECSREEIQRLQDIQFTFVETIAKFENKMRLLESLAEDHTEEHLQLECVFSRLSTK